MNRTLDEVLARLYRSEINCQISSDWDAGWTVKLGDDLNGFVAETGIDCPYGEGHRSVAHALEGTESIAAWLHEQAIEHFPESQYALESKPEA